MRRANEDWLRDVLKSIQAIEQHLERGSLEDPLIFDAVRVRLIEIGEAVSRISTRVLSAEPEVKWRQIKDMRNHLAHNYFGIDKMIINGVVKKGLPELGEAVKRLLAGETIKTIK